LAARLTTASAGALEERVAAVWPPQAWQDVPVVVAVSAGADSVALLRILARLRPPAARLWVAHFHHGLRGEAADADEQFVARLADSLKLGFRVGRAPASQLATAGDGLEAAARRARYAFLTAAAEKVGARYLAVAHTADDQAETILHRVLRGTAPAGLAGMPAARMLSGAVSLVRPLLAIRRSELRDYLAVVGQDWREDATNARTDATKCCRPWPSA
jgi:tRNA(Ile)-lysidine synthase